MSDQCGHCGAYLPHHLRRDCPGRAPSVSPEREAAPRRDYLVEALKQMEFGASNRSAYLEHGMLCASLSTGTEKGSPCDCGYIDIESEVGQLAAAPREAGETAPRSVYDTPTGRLAAGLVHELRKRGAHLDGLDEKAVRVAVSTARADALREAAEMAQTEAWDCEWREDKGQPQSAGNRLRQLGSKLLALAEAKGDGT